MMEYPTLYKKEKLTLEFIKDYMSENRTAPSLEEIRAHFGKKSLATVHKSLGQLETKGYIERNKHRGRSITLTDLALEYFELKPVNSLPLFAEEYQLEQIMIADTLLIHIRLCPKTDIQRCLRKFYLTKILKLY